MLSIRDDAENTDRGGHGLTRITSAWSRTFESYGARFGIRADAPDLVRRLSDRLPPRCGPTSAPADVWFTLARVDEGERPFVLAREGETVAEAASSSDLLNALEGELDRTVARHSRQGLFVHAGVVGWSGSAIVIPAKTFRGKSSLVAALVGAGATYYSDEFAVFDDEGHVWPYPRRLSLRPRGTNETHRLRVEKLGGVSGVKPLPVGLILVTEFRPDAEWLPEPISAGEAVLELLANTVLARTRSQEALEIFSRAVVEAEAVRSPRGEAMWLAPVILQRLAAA